jgi:tetratricopeptide (TPR) repeat protein
MGRRFGPRPLLIALLAIVTALTPTALSLAQEPTREAALEALRKGGDVEARRRGALWLAQVGIAADVPALVDALRDDDAVVRGLAEQAMWEVWSRSGDPEIDRLLALGIAQMQERDVDGAIETFTRIIDARPAFAEGWNKRATVYYLAGEYRKSLADCDEVMKRNPHHFGALSGYGMIYLRLAEPERALDYFQRALAVNPNLRGVQDAVEELKRLLLQKRRQTL